MRAGGNSFFTLIFRVGNGVPFLYLTVPTGVSHPAAAATASHKSTTETTARTGAKLPTSHLMAAAETHSSAFWRGEFHSV